MRPLAALALAASAALCSLSTATERILNEPEVLALSRCPCVREYVSRHKDAALVEATRLYVIDQKHTAKSGLHHQMSNLIALLTESFALGRAAVLGPPSLTAKHNFGKPFKYNRWGDWHDFNRSTFELKQGTRVVCEGRFASCLAEVSDPQRSRIRDHADLVVEYKDEVTEKQNAHAGILSRGSINGSKANLLRRLPGVIHSTQTFSLNIHWEPARFAREAARDITKDLHRVSKTGKIAIVHARRGDKITMNDKDECRYCCHQMVAATSPENIARVLRRNQIAAGSAVYIMTDEANWTHFSPLWTALGYEVTSYYNYSKLASLVRGCAESGTDDCENYMLFVIEEALMNTVPRESRITTLAPAAHILGGVADTLMTDFRGQCN